MKDINKIKINLLKILITYFGITTILFTVFYLMIFHNSISIVNYILISTCSIIANIFVSIFFTIKILLCYKTIKKTPQKQCDNIYNLSKTTPVVMYILGIVTPFINLIIIKNIFNIIPSTYLIISLIAMFATTVFYIFSQTYFKEIIKYTENNYRQKTSSIANIKKKFILNISLGTNLIYQIFPLILSTTFLALTCNSNILTNVILFIGLLIISVLCVINVAINIHVNIIKASKKNINYSNFADDEIGSLIFQINATKKIYDDYIKQIENIKDTEIEEERLASIEILRRTVDAKDTYTRGHSDRVSEYSVLIGKKLGLANDKIQLLKIGGLFHDIGKIGIPDNILQKTSKLTDEEYNEIKKHPSIGAHILENSSVFKDIVPIVLYHHEKYDGYGYPEKIKGEEIPLLARIVAVADTFDAMTSKRSYRDALPYDIVKQEFVKFSGTQFDPYIAKIFLNILENNYKEIEYIMKKY